MNTTDSINEQQIDDLLNQIDMQRVEVERRMRGKLHHDTHIGQMLQRRSTDPGYVHGNGAPWEFENIAQDAVIPAILAEVEVQS